MSAPDGNYFWGGRPARQFASANRFSRSFGYLGGVKENLTSRPIDSQVRIGHVHLKVADLNRALAFYCGVLGFELQQRFGSSAAFISAGGYHHHIGLNTWESAGGSPPPPRSTGLYHLAILYPTRSALADALRRLIAAGVELDGASDHGVSEALYLRDPDDNGVELYWDRPKEKWSRTPDGELAMFTRALDLDALLKVAPEQR
jgi:catechol 2,3-dioxygenase